jgi:hypothetical protein
LLFLEDLRRTAMEEVDVPLPTVKISDVSSPPPVHLLSLSLSLSLSLYVC